MQQQQPQEILTHPALHLVTFGLTLAVAPGESYATVLARFNAFRAPERQITALWAQDGRPIALTDPVRGYTRAWVQSPGN
jgi:hypothetical protein